MSTLESINMIIKTICINILSLAIFYKINNYKVRDRYAKFAIILFVGLLSAIYIWFKNSVDIIVAIFVMYMLEASTLKFFTKLRFSNVLIAVIISISASYFIFIAAATLEFGFQKLLKINNNTINIILTLIIDSIITRQLLKIKKFKNGLSFLKKSNGFMDIVLINISTFIIVIYGLLGSSYQKIIEHIYFYFFIVGISMGVTIQKIITMHYRQKLINDTINDYRKQIQQKDAEIKSLTEENFRVSKINHEFNQRQKSLELMVNNHIKNFNVEAGDDNEILNRIQKITKEHAEKMKDLKIQQKLSLTGIKEIDDMFSYMQQECKDSNIDFKLKISGNIHYMTNNLIPVEKLETLIGDHLRDAIIAVNSSNNKQREIFVVIGNNGINYELCIFDSGVEFELQTLIKLGKEPATTHKETGGTGIGFLTSFEALEESKASLEIEELVNNEYTKCVRFIFDGKNEYRIKSNRCNLIKALDKESRIILM